jgi:hypothetical protein
MTAFDPNTRGWNAHNALAMACCSDLAYEPREAVEEQLAEWRLNFVEFLNAG